MPGRRITDYQVRRYMDERRKGATQVVAAARSGLSERSGRRYERDPGLPSQRADGPRRRTRVDPLAEVWESEIVPMLAAHPHLRGTTILEELHRRALSDRRRSLLRNVNFPRLRGTPWIFRGLAPDTPVPSRWPGQVMAVNGRAWQAPQHCGVAPLGRRWGLLRHAFGPT